MPKRYRSRSRRGFRRRVRPRRLYRRRYSRVSRRRGYRRRYRGYSRRLRIATQFPTQTFKKFKWIDSLNTKLTVPAGDWGKTLFYRINDLWKPDEVNVAFMSALTELCSLYTYCKVMACKIAVRFEVASEFQGNTPNPAVMCFIATQPFGSPIMPGGGSSSSWQALRQYITGNPRYCCNKTLASQYHGNGLLRLYKYYKIGNLVGNPLEFKASTLWDQPILSTGPSASPPNQQRMAIGFLSQDQAGFAAETMVNYTLTMTFYVKFWQSKIEIS